MTAVTITVDSTEAFRRRVKDAFSGKPQQERISFASFDLLWKVLAPNRPAAASRRAAQGRIRTYRVSLLRGTRGDLQAVREQFHIPILTIAEFADWLQAH